MLPGRDEVRARTPPARLERREGYNGISKSSGDITTAGALVCGAPLALHLANAGGASDNAKKYIEAENLGGKGSEAHKAAVVGDTVGDSCKDTAAPAMNILLKLMTVVSLVAAPVIIKSHDFIIQLFS